MAKAYRKQAIQLILSMLVCASDPLLSFVLCKPIHTTYSFNPKVLRHFPLNMFILFMYSYHIPIVNWGKLFIDYSLLSTPLFQTNSSSSSQTKALTPTPLYYWILDFVTPRLHSVGIGTKTSSSINLNNSTQKPYVLIPFLCFPYSHNSAAKSSSNSI